MVRFDHDFYQYIIMIIQYGNNSSKSASALSVHTYMVCFQFCGIITAYYNIRVYAFCYLFLVIMAK